MSKTPGVLGKPHKFLGAAPARTTTSSEDTRCLKTPGVLPSRRVADAHVWPEDRGHIRGDLRHPRHAQLAQAR